MIIVMTVDSKIIFVMTVDSKIICQQEFEGNTAWSEASEMKSLSALMNVS